MKGKTITEVITALLVVLFTYTAVSKLVDINDFRETMYNQPFSLWLGDIVTWLVPVAELLVVALLLIAPLRIWGLFMSFSLMLTFSIYVALVYANAFGRVPCSCGGVIASMSWGAHLVFNIAFTGLSAIALGLERHQRLQYRAKLSRRPV